MQSQDHFGFVFNPTFGKTGNAEHNTVFGGIVSTCFNVYLVITIVQMCTEQLLKPAGVSISSYDQLWDEFSNANITFNSKEALFYPTISAKISGNNTNESGFQEDTTLQVDFNHPLIARHIKVKYLRSK